MMRTAAVGIALFASSFCCGNAQEPPPPPSASALIDALQQASYTNGVETRLKISTVFADGRHAEPVKISLVALRTAKLQRLLIRGISPASIRNRRVATEWSEDGQFKVLSIDERADGIATTADPLAPLFESQMVIWDLFAPWWNWSKQTLQGSALIDGHACTYIRSRNANPQIPIHEVDSCIDPIAHIALRTELRDENHVLLRAISVVKLVRKEAGGMAPRKLTISASDHTVSEVEVYSGDEHYVIPKDAFTVFEASSQ